jgi:hypothetical protein
MNAQVDGNARSATEELAEHAIAVQRKEHADKVKALIARQKLLVPEAPRLIYGREHSNPTLKEYEVQCAV